ncbi:MAG: energy transducer TonB [bacterium]
MKQSLLVCGTVVVILALASCGNIRVGEELPPSDLTVTDVKPAESSTVSNTLVPVEVHPEMVYKHRPDYPRLAMQAGITGTVQVRVLIDEAGKVLKAIVARSSGTVSLDEAATKAAYKNKFTPGIQEGKPIKVWVTYPVEFSLGR